MKLPTFTLRARALCIAGLVTLSTSLAQAPATGTVTGRVLNVATGRYLNNARVTVEGTNLQAQTNEFGEFRITGVPAGQARVQTFYTGLDPVTTTVTVNAGQATPVNINLTSAERYGAAAGQTVQLDAFTVASTRELEGASLAINEQRFAPNVKVVMASDAFGDVTEGNVGEFLKYLPGVTVDYVAADVRTVSVRGFADRFTSVSMDGMRTTSSASGSSARVFEFEQVSMNNASRVEVTKVPTPDSPADSLGGSVNLISKNSFERKGAAFNYRAYVSLNNEETKFFDKTPGPGRESTYKVLPGFDFDYTLPVNDRFGLVITGLSSNQFNEQHRWQTVWNYAQAGATPQNPYLQQWQIQDGPKNSFRDSVSIKADWKATDTQVISVSVQENYYKAFFANRNLNFNVGTNPAPTPASGTPLTWGQTFVQSATGRGAVTQGSSWRHKMGDTKAVNLRYNYNGPLWNAAAGLHGAKSKTWYRELARGHFSNVGTTLRGASVVRADNINFPNHEWEVRNSAGTTLDPYQLSSFNLNTAQNSPVDGKAVMKGAFLDVDREIDAMNQTFHVKVGVAVREEDRDNRRYNEQWTFIGPDGVANTADDNAGPFINTDYLGVDPYFGEPPIQWVNPYLLAEYYAQNPNHFRLGTGTNQTGVQAETNRINESEKITEAVSAAYVRLDGKMFENRLQWVTGIRFENTRDKGQGPLVNPDAAFLRGPNGDYIDANPATPGIQPARRPDAGTAGSLAELELTRIERGFRAVREYHGYYPSLHLNYNITNDFIARFAYAKTLGRPDYADIIPNVDFDVEDDPSVPGTVTVSNTGLQPWSAHNFDVSLEYYFGRGGVASAGAFLKELSNFWGTSIQPLTPELRQQFGLDERYADWTVSTQINAGDARISGAEFNLVQQLEFDFLPGWARAFTISANGTLLHLEGSNAADFRRFIPKSGNFSISWNKRPISARLNWNYRGRQKNAPQTGAQYGANAGFFEYYDSRYNIDANVEYTLSPRFRIFANARNILNTPQVLERYSAASARYATGYRHEEFGIQIAFGLKGTF
jgi:iron complex outermembrane recepter protein